MYMFGGMALAAISVLLVLFLVVYPLLKSVVPRRAIVLVDFIVGILLVAISIGLIATCSVHLILMGILVISFGIFTLVAVRKLRKC